MKKLLLLLLLFPVLSPAQIWQWGRETVNNFSSDDSRSVVIDSHGNTYITGYYTGSYVAFGADTLFGINLVSGPEFIFLVKYDASGNVVWAKNTNRPYNEGWALAIDASDNVYMTGFFSNGQLIFGSDTLSNDSVYNEVSMLLVKYNSDGNVLWARTAPATSISEVSGSSLSTDAAGNVYVAGYFRSQSLVFGTDTLKNINSSDRDLFVAKYDAAGNALWARQSKWGQQGSDFEDHVTVDASDNVYLAGCFSGASITFGDGIFERTNGGSFFVKYNAAGVLQWVTCPFDRDPTSIRGVTTDAAGNIIVAGAFSGTMIFGHDTLFNTYPTNYVTTANLFLAKYDTSGNILWAKNAAGNCYANTVTTDDSDNIIIAGGFNSDTLATGGDTLIGSGNGEALVAKYDSAGNVKWVASAGELQAGRTSAAVADRRGNNIYVTGTFSGEALAFGTSALPCVNAGWECQSIFLARLYAPAAVPHTTDPVDVHIYPNPAASTLTIFCPEGITSVSLTNMLGQAVYKQQCNTTKVEIEVAGLPAGVYLVKVNGVVKKLVKG